MKTILAIMLTAAALWTQAAPITMHTVPDSTPLLDSADPFGFGYKFTINGTDYYWTNQPSITVSGGGGTFSGYATDTVARAVAAYAYSPTNPPPVAGSPNFSTNAYTVTGPQSNLIATALQSETDAIALAALAQYAATAVVVCAASDYRISVATNEPAWILRTEGLSFEDGQVLAAGTYSTALGHYFPGGNYRIYGASWDQFVVTNFNDGNVSITFSPYGFNSEYYPRWFAYTVDSATTVALDQLSGVGIQGTAILTWESLVVVTTNYFATQADLASHESSATLHLQTGERSTWNAKADSTNGILHNATATGTFTLNGSPLGLGMTTNNVDDRVRLLAPTNSPAFSGAITLTNGTSFAAGVLNGTNGVSFTRLGTNYWILLY